MFQFLSFFENLARNLVSISVKERTKFFLRCYSIDDSSNDESFQLSLKGKNEKRKKWKMVEKEKSDLSSPGGDDPSNKSSPAGTGSMKSEGIGKDRFYIREDGVKLHKKGFQLDAD